MLGAAAPDSPRRREFSQAHPAADALRSRGRGTAVRKTRASVEHSKATRSATGPRSQQPRERGDGRVPRGRQPHMGRCAPGRRALRFVYGFATVPDARVFFGAFRVSRSERHHSALALRSVVPADFAEPPFPFALVRQRIGVRPPEFFDHFALRDERAFGLGIPMNIIKFA